MIEFLIFLFMGKSLPCNPKSKISRKGNAIGLNRIYEAKSPFNRENIARLIPQVGQSKCKKYLIGHFIGKIR